MLRMDWYQVRSQPINSGPPCFFPEDGGLGTFCGRTQEWEGHGKYHAYVSLQEMVEHHKNDRIVMCVHCRKFWTYEPNAESVAQVYQESIDHDLVCSENPLVKKLAEADRALRGFHAASVVETEVTREVLLGLAEKKEPPCWCRYTVIDPVAHSLVCQQTRHLFTTLEVKLEAIRNERSAPRSDIGADAQRA